MPNFNNISSSTNVRCSFCLHQNEIIPEFLSRRWISAIFDHWPTPIFFSIHQNEIILEYFSRWWISTIFHHRPTSDVLLSFIKITCLYNISHDHQFQQYFIIDQRPILPFSSSKDIILDFLSSSRISTVFHHSPTSDVFFFFIKIRLF